MLTDKFLRNSLENGSTQLLRIKKAVKINIRNGNRSDPNAEEYYK